MTHYPAHSRIYNIKADSLNTVIVNTDPQHSIAKSATTCNAKEENTNVLSGLLAHYDSDSEHEELNGQKTNKLDAKVDDFLQEINKIAPNESNQSENKIKNKQSCAWQECFDGSTGFPYYWNVESNEVTWEMPEEYKIWFNTNTLESKPPDKLFPQKKNVDTKNIKPPILEKRKFKSNSRIRRVEKKKTRRKSSDSEEEKIVMITSFSEESSSESDHEDKTIVKIEESIVKSEELVVMGPHIEDIPKNSEVQNKKEIIEDVKEENIDETIILARLRTQAKVLHELGGELPKSLDKSIIVDIPDKPQSLALVAGYGDDSEPEEEPITKSLFPICSNSENSSATDELSQSTLFPLAKPIDVKQFQLPVSKSEDYTTKEAVTDSIVDNKIFKRKKRLGITFDMSKTEKKPKLSGCSGNTELDGEDRKGFGFQSETNASDDIKTVSFVKSGISFVKAVTLNPVQNDENQSISTSENEDKLEDFEEIKDIVSQKVNFLGEGKDPVSAVQVMAIQLQTLQLAYKAGGLTQKYLYSWLRETFVDLEKLEQEATPEGWQCQWDRSNKRYFYRNVSTGEWQWEFPMDIVGGGEAMDICTTPPPNEESENIPEPQPLPPKCSPTPPPPPPPPPIITLKDKRTSNKHEDNTQPPIPSTPPPIEVTPPPPPTISVSENQPLPPGVDSSDLPFFISNHKDNESSMKSDTDPKDSLGSELDSFYSDIAMLEATTTSGSGTEATKYDMENVPSPSSVTENSTNDNVVKKKKKSKSKLGQGINMKKKAVSTLVEKWKKVQNDYL